LAHSFTFFFLLEQEELEEELQEELEEEEEEEQERDFFGFALQGMQSLSST